MAHSCSVLQNIFGEVAAAGTHLEGFVLKTPVRTSVPLSRATGANVHLKLEHLQVTGSFKVRGALHKLLSTGTDGKHIVAASTGNHALAVAYACTVLGKTCTLFLPESAKRHKIAALRQYGAALHLVPGDAVEAEYQARRTAAAQQQVFVSPYNDPAVIGGQGTVGTELATQVPDLDCVLVAVGGGGLISGVAAAFRAQRRRTRIIACSPEASPVMHESIRAGRIVHLPSRPTLSDGTAGGLEAESITFELCQMLVDDWLLVGERQIAEAMQRMRVEESLTVEGAAGVAVAALLSHRLQFQGKRVGVVLCGRNVDWADTCTNAEHS